MLTIFLCDDLKSIAKKYKDELLLLSKKHSIPISISYFKNGESLVEFYENESVNPDVIYLDVLMDELNGIETAKKLRELGCNSEIIFLTSSEEHVFDSFNVSPVDYLIKKNGVDEHFEEVFLKAIDRAEQKQKDCFVVEANGISTKLPLNSIYYFKINNRVVTVYHESGSIDFYAKLEEIEVELAGKAFLRTHRSYLVNCKFIRQVSQNKATLYCGVSVPISSANYKSVKQVFSNYLLSS